MGKLALYKRALCCAAELYGIILDSERLYNVDYSQEQREANHLLIGLEDLNKCMTNADIAVEEILIS